MSYSVDLRERVVAAVVDKGYTIGRAAELFRVSKSSVERWLRRYRQGGDLTPRTSPGRRSALEEHREWVERHLLDNDLSHEARCDLLFEHSGTCVSSATMSRWVKRLGNTRKKRPSLQANKMLKPGGVTSPGR